MTTTVIVILEGVCIVALLAYVYNLRKSVEEVDLFSGHLKRSQAIYRLMTRFVQETGVERILLFKTENGGKKPEIGSPLSVSCIYEGPGSNVKGKYNHVSVDEEYTRILLDIKQQGRIKLVVGDMEYGLLQKLYMAEGIKFSCVFFVHETEMDFFFGSIATKAEENPFDDVKKDVAIVLTINAIRDVFKKIKK